MVIIEFIYNLGHQSLALFWTPIGMWTLLAVGFLIFLRKSARIPPQATYQISTALFLALPLGILLAFTAPFSVSAPEAFRVLDAPTHLAMQSAPTLTGEVGRPEAIWHFYHFLGGLTLGLILISLLKVLQLINETIRLNRMASTIRGVLPSEISESLDGVRKSWGIKREVYIVFSDDDHVPMTFGWRRAFIVVPNALRGEHQALHMTLIHELAHIRNADFLRQWIEKAISSFFFFNPVVHSLAGKIEQIREMSCDSEVLSQQGISPKKYAALLMEFASPQRQGYLLSISMSADKHNLKKRISAMKNYPLFSKSLFQSRKLTLVLSALLFAVCTLIVACEVNFEEDNSITIIEAAPPATTLPEVKVMPGVPADVIQEDIFVIVDDMPELIGGLESIQKNIKYPAIARKAGIEGRVFVQFVVDEQGAVVNPVVIRGIGAGCDEEAVRAIREAKFYPGRQRGKEVKVKMSIPITFRLAEETSADVAVALERLKKSLVENQLRLEQLRAKSQNALREDQNLEELAERQQEEVAQLKNKLAALEEMYGALQRKEEKLKAEGK